MGDVQLGEPGGLANILISCVAPTVGNLVADCAIRELCGLRDDASSSCIPLVQWVSCFYSRRPVLDVCLTKSSGVLTLKTAALSDY